MGGTVNTKKLGLAPVKLGAKSVNKSTISLERTGRQSTHSTGLRRLPGDSLLLGLVEVGQGDVGPAVRVADATNSATCDQALS